MVILGNRNDGKQEESMIKSGKWSRLTFTGAAVLTALGLTGLAPMSVKASPTFTSTWVDGPTALNGPPLECLGVLGGNMTNGTPVVTWTCNGHADQTWVINGVPGQSQTTIRNSQNPNKCLGVLAAATSDGSSLVIWDCNGKPDQEWGLIPYNNQRNGPFGCFTIQNFNASSKVMGVLGGNPTDGAQAVLWDPIMGHLDQAWCPD